MRIAQAKPIPSIDRPTSPAGGDVPAIMRPGFDRIRRSPSRSGSVTRNLPGGSGSIASAGSSVPPSEPPGAPQHGGGDAHQRGRRGHGESKLVLEVRETVEAMYIGSSPAQPCSNADPAGRPDEDDQHDQLHIVHPESAFE